MQKTKQNKKTKTHTHTHTHNKNNNSKNNNKKQKQTTTTTNNNNNNNNNRHFYISECVRACESDALGGNLDDGCSFEDKTPSEFIGKKPANQSRKYLDR